MELGLFVMHSEFLHDAPRRDILGDRDGHYSVKSVIAETVFEPCACCFRSDALSPELLHQAVSDLDIIRPIERLQTCRTYHLARRLPDHRTHTEPVRFVTRHVKTNSL